MMWGRRLNSDGRSVGINTQIRYQMKPMKLNNDDSSIVNNPGDYRIVQGQHAQIEIFTTGSPGNVLLNLYVSSAIRTGTNFLLSSPS